MSKSGSDRTNEVPIVVDAIPDTRGDPRPSVAQSATFDQFYRREYRPLVGLAFVLCGNRNAAEELVQDAFTTTYQKWSEVSTYDRPEAWIRTVLVNRTRSWGRRKSAEARAMTRLKGRRDGSGVGELAEPDHEFWTAVRNLPKRQSQAVALHYLEDRPVDDIAAILGCSTGTVKTHLSRGRSALSQSLSLPAPEHGSAQGEAL